MKNLKPYPNYKKSNVDWLGDVPEHWEVRKAKYLWKEKAELSELGDETLLSVSQYLGVKTMTGNQRSANLIGYKKVNENDLVINIMLAWLGGLGLSSQNGIVSPAYAVYENIFDINPKFLHYLYRTKLYLDEFARRSKGVVPSRWRMYTDDFGQVFTLLPPKTEQTVIANYLDQKTAQIDQAIAQKEDLIQLLKERQQIVIHEAVTQGLDSSVDMKDSGVEWIGKVPKHWEVKKLKYVCNLISEKIFSKESSLNYIGMENIISWTGEYIPSNSETEGLATHFQKGDILFGKLRPYLAKVHLSENEGICSTEFLIYRTRRGSLNYFIHKLMLSYNFIDIVNASTYGSKMPRANSDFIGNLLIALPPKEEQIEIVNYINDQTTKIQKSITQQTALIERLKEYKTVLIDAAVTGKVLIN